ncbi:unknown protein [Oryza sativa Japonica Group]|uniref:Os01g0925600 protein n=3 Tax=Oryza TaxID=4527 RepID=A0A8J8XYS6_ORYSJ|nr:uncharacterized protein LOC4327235 isoform X1 [Oryza sativa Japonica Group]EEE55926.1 hypothetical protein OsJ_04609 [Oryza sativa Japonica Group]BAD88188.1 unknown protein [Oryza sativa Japonica Group]BAF07171.2 Os01g0925600 [Oryza sativa Japonica Group]BAG91899.1 unnamed protein product [Oryza sativa Japonica Group]BAS75986.1 Os01g0925600 [Oryza sativa Japonica Group]|eukprot:NP_001045257.2 Os01g0925600 [Oryza sativa Japonica Group]
MGCAASATDSAERRRPGRSPGHDGEQQQQQDGRRRGCKVAPEPKEEDGAAAAAFLASMPGSPSFRYYCQKSATVDAIVADADGDGDSDGDECVRITETPQPIKNNGHGSSEVEINPWLRSSSRIPNRIHPEFNMQLSKSAPEASRWVRFRGLALAAWCSLFSRHSRRSAASAPSHPPPPPPPAKSHQRFDAAAPAERSVLL